MIPVILKNLNKEQRKAVTFGDGPILVISGAGTGKTTVITNRIVWLAEKRKARINEILALTFTEKAAGEMQDRVENIIEFGYFEPWISTFHSFCERILRESGIEIGISSDFKIADEIQSWLLFEKMKDDLKLNYYKSENNIGILKELFNHFSFCKEQGIYPNNYPQPLKETKSEKEKVKEIINIYNKYQLALADKNLLDFGDLINHTITLFSKRPSILKKYQKQFKYILIDEFQDTNLPQYKLIKKLAFPRNNLMVCADDDQSIYNWRGASFENIINFKRDYKKASNIVLNKNYRSPQKLLDKAYELIQINNPFRLEHVNKVNKKLISSKKSKEAITHLHFSSVEEEARGVANEIIKILKTKKDHSLADFAIMGRTNNDLRIFIDALEKANIPYSLLSRKEFYSKPTIIDIISYFKVLNDYNENPSLFRILSFPCFELDFEEIISLSHFAKRKSISLYEALKFCDSIPEISKNSVLKIQKIQNLIKKHVLISFRNKVSEVFISFINDSGYLDALVKRKEKKALDDVDAFFNKIKHFENYNKESNLSEFIKEIELESEGMVHSKFDNDISLLDDSVKVMTIHSAKGLEFNYVFLISLVNKRFPTIKRKDKIIIPNNEKEDLEFHLREERRLFYVGMTRAKEKLFLTSAKDYGGITKKRISIFLKEIGIKEEELKSRKNIKNKKTKIISQSTDKLSLPEKFSFTQLAAFSNCPLQYKFAHVFKIPTRERASLNFGKTIHDSLYEYQLISQKKKTSLDEFLKIYHKHWKDDWHYNKKSEKELFKYGEKIIKETYNDFSKNKYKILTLGGKPALEVNFNFKLDEYKFFGKIDRIDKTKEGAEIIDYKTSTSEKKRKKIGDNGKKQLLIYWLAAKSMKIPVSKLSIHYLGEEIQKISINPEEEDIDKIREDLINQIKAIQNSKFLANPSWNCKYCDFRSICEFRT